MDLKTSENGISGTLGRLVIKHLPALYNLGKINQLTALKSERGMRMRYYNGGSNSYTSSRSMVYNATRARRNSSQSSLYRRG
jgi:hypothetical protein